MFGEFARNHFLTNLVALIGLAGNERCEEKELVHNILLYGNSGMRVRQMVFLSHIVNDRLIVADGFRFQYVTGKTNANVLVHIAKDAYLPDFPEVISKATLEIKVRWNLDTIVYECESWMLSKEINDCLPVNSRILQFRDNFDICRGTNCTTDILKYVFGVSEIVENVDYSELAVKTSLQKNIKEKLMSGKEFHFGIGKLKRQ